MLLIFSALPATGMIKEKQTSIKQTTIIKNNTNNEVQQPEWNYEDWWTYSFDFSFEINEESFVISVDLYISSLNCEIITDVGDTYTMQLQGNVGGNLYVDIEGIPNINAQLTQTELNGQAVFEKNNYAINNVNLDIDGKLKIGIIKIPLTIDLTMNFTPPFSSIEFPLYVGKEWTANGTTISITGLIKLSGISSLIPGVPDEIEISSMDFYFADNLYTCTKQENISISAGKFNAYNISVYDSFTIFYSPVAGNILTIVPFSMGNDYYDYSFEFELRSTNYKMPGAPNIPDRPTGSSQGVPNEEYSYYTRTIDPEGDQIYYLDDSDDESDSGWLGPYDSDATCNTSHIWTERGTYQVRVKAKDTQNHESHWSNPLTVSMPKNRVFNLLELFKQFLENHPNLLPKIRCLFLQEAY
jgi:hypothetical protein